MEQDPQRSRARENIVIISLVGFLGAVIVFFLDVISLGIFTYAIGVGSAVFALGCLHYLVWGRAMSEEVAAERAEMVRKEEEEAAADAHAEGIQDLSRRRGIRRGRE